MASTPLTYQLLDAVRALIASATIAGGYWHDLNGAGQVIIGEPDRVHPPRPGVGNVYLRIDRNQREYAGPMSMTENNLYIAGNAVVPYTADTPAARTLAVCKIHQDISTALETDIQLGIAHTVWTVVSDLVDVGGDEPTVPALRGAEVAFTIHVRYQRVVGGGL